ncbi:MAG: hypothetical protein Q8R56_01410, partial [Polaromonas sp.]|nr:hypothetical protein [Polaromonas sp.]
MQPASRNRLASDLVDPNQAQAMAAAAWPGCPQIARFGAGKKIRSPADLKSPVSPTKAPTMHQRRLFVTTALPYANGNFHIGHIM